MPRGDGRGPMGMGAMTGRAAGFCAGFGVPGYANAIPGRGFGTGYGRGRRFEGRGYGGGGYGWRRFSRNAAMPDGSFYGGPVPFDPPDTESEKLILKRQADALQSELEWVRKRLSEIEAKAPEA